jgi:hypothetical protein
VRQRPQGMLDSPDKVHLLVWAGAHPKRQADLDQELGEGLEVPEEGGEQSNERLFIPTAQWLLAYVHIYVTL